MTATHIERAPAFGRITALTKGATPAHPMRGRVDPGKYTPMKERVVGVRVTGSDEVTREYLASSPPPGRVWVEIEAPKFGTKAQVVFIRSVTYPFEPVAEYPVLAVHRAASDAPPTPHGEKIAALEHDFAEAWFAMEVAPGSSNEKQWTRAKAALRAARAPKDPVKELREVWDAAVADGLPDSWVIDRLQAAIAAIEGSKAP